MLLPIELVTWRAYGSIRDRSPSLVLIVYRYSVPGPTPGTCADQVPEEPSPSGFSRVRSPAQSSKPPVTKTASAWGSQTRKLVPSAVRMAPIPAAFDGAVMVMPSTIAARPIWWGVAETLLQERCISRSRAGTVAPSDRVRGVPRDDNARTPSSVADSPHRLDRDGRDRDPVRRGD